MLKNTVYYILVLSNICVLASCKTSVYRQEFPTMTFKKLPSIKLKVTNIEIISKFKQGINPPNVAHKIPISPDRAIIRWAKDRLSIAGIKNTARLTIIRADAKEIDLKLDKSLIGIFKNQQSHRFETSIEAKLEIFDEINVRRAFIEGKAEQSITVAEATPLSNRQQIWYNLVEKLMAQFNLEIQKNINQKLANYLL